MPKPSTHFRPSLKGSATFRRVLPSENSLRGKMSAGAAFFTSRVRPSPTLAPFWPSSSWPLFTSPRAAATFRRQLMRPSSTRSLSGAHFRSRPVGNGFLLMLLSTAGKTFPNCSQN